MVLLKNSFILKKIKLPKLILKSPPKEAFKTVEHPFSCSLTLYFKYKCWSVLDWVLLLKQKMNDWFDVFWNIKTLKGFCNLICIDWSTENFAIRIRTTIRAKQKVRPFIYYKIWNSCLAKETTYPVFEWSQIGVWSNGSW